MTSLSQLLNEREQLLDEMAQLGPMRKGSVSEFSIPSRRKDGTRQVRGPYLKYTVKKYNKTQGKHLKTKDEADLYRRQIEQYRHFEKLAARFVDIGERMADLEAAETDAKKNSNS
jgi:hypothetical protein